MNLMSMRKVVRYVLALHLVAFETGSSAEDIFDVLTVAAAFFTLARNLEG